MPEKELSKTGDQRKNRDHLVTVISIVVGTPGNDTQKSEKESRRTEDERKNRNHRGHSTVRRDLETKLQGADLKTRELKKLRTMMVTVISIVVGTPGTTPKSLKKNLEELKMRERTVTIAATALLEETWRPNSREQIWKQGSWKSCALWWWRWYQ